MRGLLTCLSLSVVLFAACADAGAQGPHEARAAAAFVRARDQGEPALRALLDRMPKGANLHMHLSGAVYAETFLADAAADGLCVDPVRLAFVKRTPAESAEATSKGVPEAPCAAGFVRAADVFADQALYDKLIDSFSMRAFVSVSGTDGHDQFFGTFGRFGGIAKSHQGEWLDELATRAAAENVQYLEVMETPEFTKSAKLGRALGWPAVKLQTTAENTDGDDRAGTSTAELTALRDKLLAGGLSEDVATDRANFAEALRRRQQIEHCGTPAAAPACSVAIHFLFQVLRAFPPAQVFAQSLLGFEVAEAEIDSGAEHVVGINFVQPEDTYLAMSEYRRQMAMVAFLHGLYPRVHISLHAGELAEGMVPPAGLRFHIRDAVETGHAERIGHGVDVMHETDAEGLLREMRDRNVMVEINLTSNDGILGIKGVHAHPLPAYLAAGVPVALATDDEGVSRIDLTHEYVRAALEFRLSYAQLKRMAETSVEHEFVSSAELAEQKKELARRFRAFEATF